MTIRYLLVAIDDARPLGPQVRPALGVLSWKMVWRLCGARYSLRWLRELLRTSEISERHTVTFGEMVAPSVETLGGARDMAALFGGAPSAPQPQIQAPTVVTQTDPNAEANAEKERLADETSVGRSATILTDYALATQQAPVRSPTLGAA